MNCKWRQVAASGGKWLRSSISVLIIVLFVQNIYAQVENPFVQEGIVEPAAYVSFEIQDTEWTLFPVITADDTLVGFFGYMPDEFVVGDNVSLLWLIPDNSNGTWSMYGWSHTDLKVVSQYLDQITNTPNVLADTGLDVFAGDPQPITEPQSMPFGIAEDDPAAPIVEATQDPLIASALIAVGAAGAPNLTEALNLQPIGCDIAIVDGSGVYSTLDMMMAFYARGVQDQLAVWPSDGVGLSIDATGYYQDPEAWCCWPITYTVYGAWSPWNCTGGTPPGSPTVGVGSCTWTGCTRCRPTFVVTVNWNCVTGSFAGPIDCTAPSTEVRSRHPEADCPPVPSP